jgi:hypothetical protein
MLDDRGTLKKQHRRNLAKLPFEIKIAMLINMQKIAQEMALSSGRKFKGTVWCEENLPEIIQDDNPNPKDGHHF